MYSFALRSLLARRWRAALTALSVTLGVAMVSGTLVFTDTIHNAFRQLFSSQVSGSDLVVSSPQGLYSQASPPTPMPASLAARIRKLPGVAAAAGQVSGVARILSRDGRAIGNLGSPTLGRSYLGPPFAQLRFTEGRAPTGPGQVALDQSTATRARYHLGDRVPIVTGEPVRRFVLTGIIRAGSASVPGTTFAIFDPPTAGALFGKQGLFDAVYVSADAGTPAAQVENEIRPLLPSGVVVRPSSRAVNADLAQVGGQLRVLTGGLEAFGFVAVFVGAFVIFNTLAITVTQRARELALLRAVGATRGQVLGSVIAEALAVGSLASLVGVFAGLAVALAIRALFGALGVNVPSTGLVLESRTLLVSLGTGIPVTVAAGLPPAVRATRLSPVEALQQSSMPASRGGRYPLALIPAVPLALGGIALVFGYSGTGGQKLTACAAGAVMLVLASVLLSPVVVPAISRLVALPLGSGNRIVAKMARENATRAPARTALTAASLMIGLTLVLFVSVYESAVRTSATKAIDRTFAADFAIGSADGSSSIPAASARAVAVVPYVLAVSSVKTSVAQIGSAKRVTAAGIDPTTIGQLYRFDWVGGAPPLATLAPGDLLVERDTASAAGLHVGQPVELRTAAGVTAQLTVAGIYADRALLRGFALPMTEFDRLFSQDRLQQVLVKFQPGVDLQSAEAELRQALSALPGVVVRSEQQLKNATSVRLHGVLALFYALLAMSIVMALIGILNALTLAVHERTRELGLLRVVGMTPRQARSLVRDESVITAAIGTTVGLVLGVALAWLVTRSLRSEGITFELPWLRVALLAACGLAVGVLAAVPAAVKASRLDVLTAIAHE